MALTQPRFWMGGRLPGSYPATALAIRKRVPMPVVAAEPHSVGTAKISVDTALYRFIIILIR